MPIEDKQLGLRIMKEFTKRASIDSSDVRIHVSGGTVYLNGRLKGVRGGVGLDLKKEAEIIERNLRTVNGVRDVVNELDLR
ncbi:MAG TPA: BON domain-containing protein [Armatimonadota bacterium]|nr:BON domain-containing protein [Armatimonadota bacterium]